MSNYINIEYYLPKVKDFFIHHGEDLRLSGYDQNPFVPYTMGEYQHAPLKVFYIGRDTYYWTHKISTPYNDVNIKNYLVANANFMTVEKIKDWKNTTSFWGVVARLQLMLRTQKYYQDITHLTNEELMILEEIGYGNLNSIELLKTIEDRGGTEITDRKAYNRIVEAAKPIQSINGVIEAYNPDVIFILTWTGSEKELLDNGFIRVESYYDEPLRAVYQNEAMKKIVIWSNHPRNYSFNSKNMEEMCKYLYDTYVELPK